MNTKRVYWLMQALLIVLIISIFGAVYEGSNLLVKQSNKLLALKVDSAAEDQQQTSLVQAKKDIQKYTDLNNAASYIVPQDKDQAQTVREIVKIAGTNKVALGAITFPSSSLGQKAISGATGSTNQSKISNLTQVQPVTGLKGVYVMPITIESDANSTIAYTSFIAFLQGLENNRRTAQVSSISITPDKQNNNNLSFSLILNVYIKP